jgi:hypothetical protein
MTTAIRFLALALLVGCTTYEVDSHSDEWPLLTGLTEEQRRWTWEVCYPREVDGRRALVTQWAAPWHALRWCRDASLGLFPGGGAE